ncbi:MAG: cytochrome c family protein [Candidatus Neomarinimicrobiota bacterium]
MVKRMILILAATGLVFAQSFEYVGVDGCKMCHKSEAKGAQFAKWEADVHAKAFETLKNEASAKIAKDKGIAGPAWEAAECLACHTTGFGAGGYAVKDAKFWEAVDDKGKPTKEVKTMAGLQSVSCEACHGPGSAYKSSKVMKDIFAGTVDGKTVGLIEPNEALCVTCHNQKSPTFKPFKFADRVKEIAHPYPAELKK